MENSGGEGGLAILEFGGQGGDKHFGISEGKGGLKYSCRPWYGMDIFWNHPFINASVLKLSLISGLCISANYFYNEFVLDRSLRSWRF